MRSNYVAARTLEEEALALFSEVGDTAGRVFALENLISVLFFQGEYAQAQALLEESLELCRQGGDTRGYAAALLLVGIVLLFEGDLAGAYARLEESLAVSKKRGYKWNIATSIHFLGLVAFLQGDVARARSLLEESLTLFQEIGDRGSMAQLFFSQGFISLGQGDYATARTLMEQSLEIAKELDRKWDIALGLEGLAAVVAAQGEPVRAVWLISTSQALREAIGVSLPSLSQAMHEFTITSVRTHLGEQAFNAAWTQGQTMTPEHVLLCQEPMPGPPLTTLSPASVAPPPPPHAGLTPRERDVLRLLAQGLTSAQIAEQLVIGLVTVNAHVRSIYSKLGVTSRAAATRYALDHQLL
jgi:ATP/maltotriose-dependent transcriptional regulator MalT